MIRRNRSLGALLALLVTGCGTPEVSSAATGYLCTSSEARLGERVECVDDADCPCGSFCEVGLCAHECSSDAECEDGALCDAFGRCRDDGGGVVAPRPSEPVGRVVTDTTALALDEAHPTGVLTVTAEGAPISPVRVAADGVELHCPGSDAATRECRFESVSPGDAPIAIGVSLAVMPETDTSYAVRVFGEGQPVAVNVVAAGPVDEAPRSLDGVWSGTATLVRSGSVARSASSDTPETLRALSLPIEVRIHAESGGRRTVVLSDASGFVFPDSPTVGVIERASDGSLRLSHVARPYVEGAEGNDDGAHVLASAESVPFTASPAGLSIDLRTTLAGIVDDAYAPFVDWHLALGRTGDLDAGESAPPQPIVATVGSALTRARTALTLESPARTALGGLLGLERRAEAALCTPEGARDPVVLSRAVASPWSGDLGCNALDSDVQPRVFGVYGESAWNIASTIGTCVADLQLAADISSGAVTTSAPSGCIDASRFMVALSEAQAVDLQRAQGVVTSPDATSSAIAHRLVQQWSHMLAFVTSQSVQIDRLNDVLASPMTIDRDFTQRDMLELTAGGWDVLLQPRVAMPLTLMPGDVVRHPDYRERLDSTADYDVDPRHDIDVGLPVTLARDLSRSLSAHGALLERARYVTSERGEIERLSVAFVRRSIALFAFATLLHDYARAASPDALPWAVQWDAAASGYGVALSGLVRNLENLREGRNPLDIDDELDLPLYRIGDEGTSLDRFSAVTDYLLGTGATADTAPVPAAVIEAERALGDARTSYESALRSSRDFAITTVDQMERRNAVREEFGEDIVSLCGDPDYDADAIIEGRTPVDAETCWIRPDCRRSPEAALLAMQPEDLAFTLCYVNGVRALLGADALPAVAATLTADEARAAATSVVRGHTVTTSTVSIALASGAPVSIDRGVLLSSTVAGAAGLSTEDGLALTQQCRAIANTTEGARPHTSPSSCTLHGDCSSGSICSPSGACVVDEGTVEETSCFRGAVGEIAASLRSAITDVRIARSELADLTATYDLRMETCAALIETNDAREDAIDANLRTQRALGAVQLAADVAANVADGALACSTAAAADTKFGAAAGVACTAAGLTAALRSLSDGLEFGMEEATRSHEAALAALDRELEETTCQNEADIELVATTTLTLRIQRSMDEIGSLMVHLENAKTAIRGSLAEGMEELAVQTSLEITPLEFDFWLGSNVVRYDSAFRRARRALYLGVIATEYEYQLSSAERSNVLAATRVEDLRAVLTRLRNLAGTGTVAGAAPSDLHAVVSLRDELLRVADRSGAPEGEHTLTAEERFRVMLSSPRFRVFAEDGTYLGQEVPFRLAPGSVFGGTDPAAIPLLTGSDCAERLWSINASILGEDVLHDTDSTRTRITIRQRNAFFSQWCGGATSASPFQYAATRPSRNLFLDPFTDYVPAAHPAPMDGTSILEAASADAYTSARLSPEIGVTRSELESDAYVNGSSRELAGRGVYGEYSLFLPAEILSTDGGPGLDLERIDDILLRVDYVSVARD